MPFKQRLSKEQAFQKAKHYCAYQERSHYEVKEKLYSFGLYKQEVEELLSRLIEEDYLNEERFAIQFAGGKFRMKQWGRIKIKYELKQKYISEYCIKKALKEINESDYTKTLQKLAAKKWTSIKGRGENKYTRIAKTTEYLLQKGYESALITAALQELKAND
jgi:regulatory protein